MNIQAEKIELIQMLLATESELAMRKVKSILLQYVNPLQDETEYLNSSLANIKIA